MKFYSIFQYFDFLRYFWYKYLFRYVDRWQLMLMPLHFSWSTLTWLLFSSPSTSILQPFSSRPTCINSLFLKGSKLSVLKGKTYYDNLCKTTYWFCCTFWWLTVPQLFIFGCWLAGWLAGCYQFGDALYGRLGYVMGAECPLLYTQWKH